MSKWRILHMFSIFFGRALRSCFGTHLHETFWCNFLSKGLQDLYSLRPLPSLNTAMIFYFGLLVVHSYCHANMFTTLVKLFKVHTFGGIYFYHQIFVPWSSCTKYHCWNVGSVALNTVAYVDPFMLNGAPMYFLVCSWKNKY